MITHHHNATGQKNDSMHQPVPRRHNKWRHFDDNQQYSDDSSPLSIANLGGSITADDNKHHGQFKKVYLNLPEADLTLRLSSPPPCASPAPPPDWHEMVEEGPIRMPPDDLDHRHEHLPPGMVSLWDGRLVREDEVGVLLGIYSDVDLRQEAREGFVILRRRVIVVEKGERMEDNSQCFHDDPLNDHPPLYYPPIVIDSYE